MIDEPFGLGHASDICLAPFLVAESHRELRRNQQASRAFSRERGAAWSGLTPPPSPTRSPADVHAAAEAALGRAQQFAESPRGRFLSALRSLGELGYAAQAEQARAAFARGFADPDRPPCVVEIAKALGVLARLNAAEARPACLALSDLLAASLRTAPGEALQRLE